jgi:hypothetical protein
MFFGLFVVVLEKKDKKENALGFYEFIKFVVTGTSQNL